jgi:hypothetical protein
MNSKRLYFIMLAVVGLMAVILIGGAYGANSVLQSRSKAVVAARSKATALEQQQTQLSKAKASIAKYKDVAKIAKSIVPQDKDQAQAVRELVKIASDNGIKLGTISFPTSTLGATATGATSGANKATPAAPLAASTTNLSQLKAAPGITGVYTLQITAQSDSASPTPYSNFTNFLSALEHNRRTALVSAITLEPDTKDPTKVTFSLTIDEYIKP